MATVPLPADEDQSVERCDHCGLPLPPTPIVEEIHGQRHTFCSNICRNAFRDDPHGSTAYHGFKRFDPGVAALSDALPDGIPRNSFVLVSTEPGTRDSELHAELVWRTLQRGEPAIVVAFQEPPISIVEQFIALDWNVIPYIEAGQLNIIDCFTYRVDVFDRMLDRLSPWNQYLQHASTGVRVPVRNPTDLLEAHNKLDSCIERLHMRDQGIVIIDSLVELGTMVQPIQAYDFVKDVRADLCKGRFIPVFGGATYTGNVEEFPHDLLYMMDGIIDTTLGQRPIGKPFYKYLSVRKMRAAPTNTTWMPYEYTSGNGLVTLDPRETQQIESGGLLGEDSSGPAG